MSSVQILLDPLSCSRAPFLQPLCSFPSKRHTCHSSEGCPRATGGPGPGHAVCQKCPRSRSPQEALHSYDQPAQDKGSLPSCPSVEHSLRYHLCFRAPHSFGTLLELTSFLDFSVPVLLPPSLAGFSWNPSLVPKDTDMLVSEFASVGPPVSQKMESWRQALNGQER